MSDPIIAAAESWVATRKIRLQSGQHKSIAENNGWKMLSLDYVRSSICVELHPKQWWRLFTIGSRVALCHVLNFQNGAIDSYHAIDTENLSRSEPFSLHL